MFRILLSKPIFVLLIFILIFYMWNGTAGREDFWQYHPKGWYNLLVDGFLKRQLHFPVKVAPELLNLPDPYNPDANAPYRLHDMAYYKGKYYLYYGVTAAVLLYLPVRVLTGIQLPDSLVIISFMFGGLLFAVAVLYHVRNKFFQQIPELLMLISVGVLAFSNVAPFILKRSLMYEIASSCGYFFLMGGMYFLLKSITSKEKIIRFLVLGSLFLGLSIGGRPHFIFASVAFVIVYWKLIKDGVTYSQLKLFLSMLLPFSILVVLYALYNYLRFENPFEFGLRYIHAGIDIRNYKFLDFANFQPGAYLYLLQKPIFDLTLPFVHINGHIPRFITPPQNYFFIGVVGIIYLVPLIPLAIFSSLLIKLSKIKSEITFPLFEFLLVFLPGIVIMFFLILAPQVEFRYLSDFLTLYILSALLVLFYVISILKRSNIFYKLTNGVFIFCSLLSILFGLAFGTEPYFRKLQRKNPVLYTRIESTLRPIVDIFI